MYTSDYRKEGERILESYVKQAGKEPVIAAYLTQVAYGVFVREYPMSAFCAGVSDERLGEKVAGGSGVQTGAFEGSGAGKGSGRASALCAEQRLLEECVEHRMVFAFFRRLSPALLSPYQLDDKVYGNITARRMQRSPCATAWIRGFPGAGVQKVSRCAICTRVFYKDLYPVLRRIASLLFPRGRKWKNPSDLRAGAEYEPCGGQSHEQIPDDQPDAVREEAG